MVDRYTSVEEGGIKITTESAKIAEFLNENAVAFTFDRDSEPFSKADIATIVDISGKTGKFIVCGVLDPKDEFESPSHILFFKFNPDHLFTHREIVLQVALSNPNLVIQDAGYYMASKRKKTLTLGDSAESLLAEGLLDVSMAIKYRMFIGNNLGVNIDMQDYL